MSDHWVFDPQAVPVRRLGKSPQELGNTTGPQHCPDIWEMSNGDYMVIGTDATQDYLGRLPDGLSIARDEKAIVIPRSQLAHAKTDIVDP